MKLILEESYEGEFSECDADRLRSRLEDAIQGVRSGLAKASGFKPPQNGSVDAIEEIAQRMAVLYEARLKRMSKAVVHAVRTGKHSKIQA